MISNWRLHLPSWKKPRGIIELTTTPIQNSSKYILLFLLLFFGSAAEGIVRAQVVLPGRLYEPEATRILFLLDGSGSMNETWNGRTKFEVARELLEKAIDSVTRENNAVEFGLRVFGHQFSREQKNCEDSRLEVAFGRDNAGAVREVLAAIEPKGYTPIAYSLFLAAHDFPAGKDAVNAIILITDGQESCSGDPCASSEALRNRRIALKPYIIGLGLNQSEQAGFDCVGSYYDAGDPSTFQQVLGVVISQALRNTTLQVNLLDQLGRATETDVELTFYDAYTGKDLYNLVHSTLRNGAPDTLYLDPAGIYNLDVHTTPPVRRQNIELIAGKHNIIAVEIPQGELVLQVEGNSGFTDLKCLVRDPATLDIVYVQNFNTVHRYLAGTYNLEILTLPRIEVSDFPILPGQINPIKIAAPGRLLVQTNGPGILGVFVTRQQKLVKVFEWPAFSGQEVLDLQPGEYTLVFRPARNRRIDDTREIQVVIYPSKSTTAKLP